MSRYPRRPGGHTRAALDQVDEPTRRRDEKVATHALELAELVADARAAVDDGGGDAGAVDELLRLVVDLYPPRRDNTRVIRSELWAPSQRV